MKPEELKIYTDFMKSQGLLILSIESPSIKLYFVREGAEKLVPLVATTKVSNIVPVESTKENPANENIVSVTSPLVGTFYRASVPGAAPYVEEGQEIKVDDTLCIVDAMKNSNFIKSEVDGKIIKINVENGKIVEFGQILFLIEKKETA